MTTVRFKIDLGKPKRVPKPKPPPIVRNPGPSREARALALAHWIERRTDSGDLADYATAARALGLSRSRLTQVMNMLLLPVETQEKLLLDPRSLLPGEVRAAVRARC
ncbi:MAG: hypothetical protein IT453_04690 [Planctomycetes bacterium]|nr:hypothetical protein [Planctomycetota bacterium]